MMIYTLPFNGEPRKAWGRPSLYHQQLSEQIEAQKERLRQALTNNKTIYHKNAEDFPLKSNSK